MLFIYFQVKIKFSHCIWLICFINFFFLDLFLPFYFLKWNCYFSACENLPNSSCHFWKHKSVFLQILHHYSVLSNITPLYFFSPNIIYLDQKEPIKVQIVRLLGVRVKIRQITRVNFEATSPFFLEILYHFSL